MKLSVNLNKVALLRNSRGGGVPDVNYFANYVLDQDCIGITVHPRPDARHIDYDDIALLNELCIKAKKFLNIEGNPKEQKNSNYKGFNEIIRDINPHQITLVPDESNQITSDHGWSIEDKEYLDSCTKLLSPHNQVCSIFVNSDELYLKELISENVNAIEIYTGPYANAFSTGNKMLIDKEIKNIQMISEEAKSLGLRVHAGHDLNTKNLLNLVELDIIDEVSIGHAIISESLVKGFKQTIDDYIKLING